MPAIRALLAATAILLLSVHAAGARNAEVEASLRSLNDVSDFYQAMLRTGVADELREGQSYTVFAPTNAAFAAVTRRNYPCFYQAHCRDLAAAFVRGHIIEGRYTMPGLVRDVRVETAGKNYVHAEEPFVNQYTVNDSNVLSAAEVGNSIIYRIDNFVIPQRYLGVFQTAAADEPVEPDATYIRKTTTTYVTPVEDTEVNSQPVIVPGVNADSTTVEQTTVTHVHDPIANSW